MKNKEFDRVHVFEGVSLTEESGLFSGGKPKTLPTLTETVGACIKVLNIKLYI